MALIDSANGRSGPSHGLLPLQVAALSPIRGRCPVDLASFADFSAENLS